MKITAVKPIVVCEGGRNFTFVKVETDEGIYGVGEAGLALRGQAVAEVIRSFEPDLLGEDPGRIEHLWQKMFRGGFFPGGVLQTSAISAVDIALWDLKGKALGVPVYELLGGRTRDKVVCYPHNGGQGLEGLVESCRKTVDEGWKFVRWGLTDADSETGFEPARAVRFGIEQVEAVRDALGDSVEILVDVHTRLDPSDGIVFCKAVSRFRPFFIEDPIRSENPESLKLLRSQTSVPLAIGEQYASKWQFREAVEQDLMDYCRLDVCIVGGLTEARKIAGWCETHYIQLAPHNPLGPVATAASLHLCLSSPLVGVQELARPPGSVLKDLIPVQVPFESGYLLPPDSPGLGVEIDEAAAVDLPAHPPGKGRGFERDDGSYTNW